MFMRVHLPAQEARRDRRCVDSVSHDVPARRHIRKVCCPRWQRYLRLAWQRCLNRRRRSTDVQAPHESGVLVAIARRAQRLAAGREPRRLDLFLGYEPTVLNQAEQAVLQ
jgi:hypothetical protein